MISLQGSDITRVATNLAALNAYNILKQTNAEMLLTQSQIASGKEIQKSSDSPSEYYISQTLARDAQSLSRKRRNIERGLNYLQTNNSKLEKISDIMLEMNDLAEQANSVAVTTAEQAALQTDLEQLREEVDSILQSGIDSKIYSGFTLGGLENVSLSGTGTNTTPTLAGLSLDGSNIDVETQSNIQPTIDNITSAHNTILADQSKLGSFIRRLEFEADILSAEETDTLSTLSTVADADLMQKQIRLTELEIIQDSSIAMISHANTTPYKVLDLLTGNSST